MNNTLKTGQIIKCDFEKYTIKEIVGDIIIATRYTFDNPKYKMKINKFGQFVMCNDYNVKKCNKNK